MLSTDRSTGSVTDDRFDQFKHRWLHELSLGRLAAAAAVVAEAHAWALSFGSQDQVDLCACVAIATELELRTTGVDVRSLRQILLRNGDQGNCRLAAYTLARHYELGKEYKKALFYARIARDRSVGLGRDDYAASSHNQVGNSLLALCQIDDACREYESALELMPPDESAWRARILDNLGYCRILQGRHAEGYGFLYESLGILRRLGARRYQISTRLDLSFAHLETGRLRYAARQAGAALALAEEFRDNDSIKNALFLLGEARNLSGAEEEAEALFGRLQQEFFPEQGYLSSFLLSIDVRKLVNLHA
jgi:tetratricopeptide (TPR) repeat protein